MSLPPKPGSGRPGFRPATTAASQPATRPIAESLAGDGGLSSLLARVRASEARLQDLRGIVPADLLGRLRAGPLDAESWTLLATSAAVAAKLRHLLPTIAEGLRDKGWEDLPVRVKVHVAGQP
jgi:hypothetical protein